MEFIARASMENVKEKVWGIVWGRSITSARRQKANAIPSPLQLPVGAKKRVQGFYTDGEPKKFVRSAGRHRDR